MQGDRDIVSFDWFGGLCKRRYLCMPCTDRVSELPSQREHLCYNGRQHAEVDKVRAAASRVVSVMLSEGECLNNALNNEWYAE